MKRSTEMYPEQDQPEHKSLLKEWLASVAISTPQVVALLSFAHAMLYPPNTVDTSLLVNRGLQLPENRQPLTPEEAENMLGGYRSVLDNPPGIPGVNNAYGSPKDVDLLDIPAPYLDVVFSIPLSNPPAGRSEDTATLAAEAIRLAGGDDLAQEYARHYHEITRPRKPSLLDPHAWLLIKPSNEFVRELNQRAQEFELRAVTGLTAALFGGVLRLAHRFSKMQRYQEQDGQIGCFEQGKFVALSGAEIVNLIGSYIVAAHNLPLTATIAVAEIIKTSLAMKNNNNWLSSRIKARDSMRQKHQQESLNKGYSDVEEYLNELRSRLPRLREKADITLQELAFLAVEEELESSIMAGEPYNLNGAHQTHQDFSDPQYSREHFNDLTPKQIRAIRIKRLGRTYADLESNPETAMNPPKTRAQYEEIVRARIAAQKSKKSQ